MEIRLINQSSILLAGKKAKVALNFDGTEAAGKSLGADIFINGQPAGELLSRAIDAPGEYEKSDVLITAYQTKINLENRKADIYEVSIDDVNVCYVSREVSEIPDFVSEEMGYVNVLVLDVSNVDNAKKIVNEIEPHIVIPLGSTEEELKKFISTLGLAGYEKEAKIRVEREDFLDEEMPMRLVHLSKE